jgi:non-specific serine/threonine protein kinase
MWAHARRVFEAALDCTESERKAFVEEACAGAPEVQREVEALLEAYERTGTFLGPRVVEAQFVDTIVRDWPADERDELPEGTVLDRKYRIEARIGRGGMGTVYRATQLLLHRPVALKLMRSDVVSKARARERFEREALAIARLKHASIVTIHDFGIDDEWGAYIVMEYVEGRTLREELRARKALALDEALEVIREVCGAVAAAHGADVLHCDLKPENILLERSGDRRTVKVVDFGLARLGDAARVRGEADEEGALGTPAYMPPEQIRGEAVDARSDLYAIACVLYELLTGRPPFVAPTILRLFTMHERETAQPIRELVADLPIALESAIARALSKRPEDRHPSIDEFAAAIGAKAAPARVPTRPIAATRFVGRERQVEEVRERLVRDRLVTLAGPGGIGKTRLALAVADDVERDYAGGVWFATLDAVADPALVVRAIADALGVRADDEREALERIAARLTENRSPGATAPGLRTLLVVDNCEHLVEASARVVRTLLEACPNLRVLATSRESLDIPGEAIWRVPPLALPSSEDPALARESEAIRLFLDRASLRKPGFAVGDATMPALVALCRRLDGIPLAIEFAAARVGKLSIEQILDRLEDSFMILTGGARGGPTRQQTLRATLDWSYDLLDEEERALFRRLGVFVGGWTLEAAEAIGGEGDARGDVLEILTHLVDKSLVYVDGPDARFRMLETVRDYALSELRSSGDYERAASRHARTFAELAGRAAYDFGGPREAEMLARLEAEHDNIRAALRWLIANDADSALEYATSLQYLWATHGHLVEGRRWMEEALAAAGPRADDRRMWALRVAGELAWRLGDLATARAELDECMRLARELSDDSQLGWSAYSLALVVREQGDAELARAIFEEGLASARRYGKQRLVGNILNSLGEMSRLEGEWAAARELYERALDAHRGIGHEAGLSVTLNNLGAVACEVGDLDAATDYYRDALRYARAFENAVDTGLALDGFAAIAAKRGDGARSARLAGAARALRARIGHELEASDAAFCREYLEEARALLGDEDLERGLAEGAKLSLADALVLAVPVHDPS